MGKRFFTFALCFFCGFAFGQDYSNLIEKGKYAKVYQKCSKKLSKAPDDIELLYFMAVVTSRQEAGKLCDPLKSYTNYLKAVNLFNSTLDERRLEKLEKIPINSKTFKVLSDSIFTSGLAFAATANTEASYISYLNTYTLAGDYYKQIAKAERNRLAFATALSANSITAFTEFVYKYPDALQVTEAWSNVYRLAYLDAQSENTIQSYESFISKYPKAPQVGNANQAIHLLAFEEAKRVDNSSAYKNFIDTYPNSIQNAEATGLYQLRQFEENTVPGMWESYRDFYIRFDNPYKTVAIDSLMAIALDGSNDAFEYLIENNIRLERRSEFIFDFFSILSRRGEFYELAEFYKRFSSEFNFTQKQTADREIQTAMIAVELKLDEPFDEKRRKEYIDYIKIAGKTELAYVALQRLLSKDIEAKRYNDALRVLEDLESYFTANSIKVQQLKDLLKARPDLSIVPISLKEVNTFGNEYSPVISANDGNLYFCGKDRSRGETSEKLFLSYYRTNKWTNPVNVDIFTAHESNNAPVAISADGNILYMFSDGDIYETSKSLNGWSELTKMNEQINSNLWEGDLTIASDNNALIFARGDAVLEKKVDIVFLVDATGSMGPCINGVKENISNFIDGLAADNSSVSWRSKVLYYRDIEIDGYMSYVDNPFTDKISELNMQLDHEASGGGDEPESTMESIYKAIVETDWREDKGTARVIITFTDATNKPIISRVSRSKYGEIGATRIVEKLKANKIKLYLFAQNDTNYELLDCSNSDVTLYGNAVNELQTADYSVIMTSLSEKVSLLSSNSRVFHGDRLPVSDLFLCLRDNNNLDWGKPIKLPSSINTPFTERSPFLHPDMKTLYFSSDGYGGLGKLDVYVSTRLADTCWDCWSTPVNLGKEINGPNSDWGYKISTDGQVAYFSKDSRTKSREDIYKINLPAHLRPDFVARIEGSLTNSNNEPVSTTIRWEDIENNKIIGTSKTDPSNGSYFIVLPMGKNYGYYIEDTAYFPLSQNLDLRHIKDALEIKRDMLVVTFQQMINEGLPVPMNNLFFDFGKHDLLPASIPELTRISGIIQRYNLKVEIAGHTDDVSDDKFNQQLSEKRADAVKDFLISRGCSKSLLVTKGYGESKPVAPNDSEENRAKNRRVELRFIK